MVSRPAAPQPATLTRWQKIGPIVGLLILAPVISEVLYGATRLSVIFVLVPEILTWGCAALLIRETVRRWDKGWPSMLLLGIALAIAEEWIIQQTSIAPLVGLAKHAYGRVWGVNWVYFLWAVGYESVWVVLIPVHLTELIFPFRRNQSWLRTRGLVITGFAFIIGAYMAWYGWTQRARVLIFHMPPYSPPMLYIAAAIVVIASLVAVAYLLPSRQKQDLVVPSPGIVGLTVTIFGTIWSAFVMMGYGSFPAIRYDVALAGGAALCILSFVLMDRWTSSHAWSDFHSFAAALGGILGCILGGFIMFKIGGALRIDWVGKTILDLAAIAWLLTVGRRITRRA